MKKYKISEKAFEIDLSKIEEGFLFSEHICYAENINKAKSKLLKEIKYDDYKLNNSNDDITYTNIPVIRCKEADKVIFEDKIVLISEIEKILHNRERNNKLDSVLNNPNILYCYIIKGSYYCPNYCGYTSIKTEAGIYTKEDAISHAKSVDNIRLEPIDIEEHNKMIKEKISMLQTKLL